MNIFNLQQIKVAVDLEQNWEALMEWHKSAMIDFVDGLYEVPMPMQLIFPETNSDSHVKAAFKHNSKNFIIKIANSVYGPTGTSDGVILIFSKETGSLLTVLQDEGWLTTLRTAIAGLVAARLTPWKVDRIGVIGAGNLAKTLYALIKRHFPETDVCIYGRNKDKAMAICSNVCKSVSDLMMSSDLVFSATASNAPIITASDTQARKHIIALGADDDHKQECHPDVFAKCDLVIVDSKLQAFKFGDTHRAIAAGKIAQEQIVELGAALKHGIAPRNKLILTDLTGIASQDVAMAEFILPKLLSGNTHL